MLEIVGTLLAIGTALDVVSTPAWKKAVVAYLAKYTLPVGVAPGVAALSDRIFGASIFSARALLASALLTIILTIAMIVIANILNPEILPFLLDSLKKSGANGYLYITIAFIFVIAADFASYAQTRLFMIAIDVRKSGLITFTMLFADILASLVIFSLVFSVGRLLIYVLIINNHEPLEIKYRTAPEVIAVAVQTLGSEEVATNISNHVAESKKYPMTALVGETLAFKDDPDTASAKITRYANEDLFKLIATGADYVVITSETECYESVRSRDVSGFETIDAYLNSNLYLYQARNEDSKFLDDAESDDIDNSVKDALDKILIENGDCSLNLLTTTKKYDLYKMIKWLSPWDMYLASLLETFSSSLANIPRKFAYYEVVDFGTEVQPIVASMWDTKAIAFLGPTADAQLYRHIASEVRDARAKERRNDIAPMPITTFLASSFGATLLLFFSVLLSKTVRYSFAMRGYAAKVFKSSTVNKSVFLFISTTVSLFILALYGANIAISYVWRFIFS